jgi:hypothetical protein
VDPVGSAKCHWPHRILGEIVTQFQFWIVEESGQLFPECQRVFACLTGLASGQHGLTRGQDVLADFIEYGRRLFLAQEMTCGVIHFFLARLGVDQKQLVHQLNCANRAGILLVELDRIYKVPSRVAPAASVHHALAAQAALVGDGVSILTIAGFYFVVHRHILAAHSGCGRHVLHDVCLEEERSARGREDYRPLGELLQVRMEVDVDEVLYGGAIFQRHVENLAHY